MGYFNDPFEATNFGVNAQFMNLQDAIQIGHLLYNRVFCLAESPLNSIMWSHYGTSHKGLCVGYDEDDIIKSDTGGVILRKVKYIDPVAPRNNTIRMLSTAQFDVSGTIFVKDTQWDYENEWRAVYHITEEEMQQP